MKRRLSSWEDELATVNNLDVSAQSSWFKPIWTIVAPWLDRLRCLLEIASFRNLPNQNLTNLAGRFESLSSKRNQISKEVEEEEAMEQFKNYVASRTPSSSSPCSSKASALSISTSLTHDLEIKHLWVSFDMIKDSVI